MSQTQYLFIQLSYFYVVENTTRFSLDVDFKVAQNEPMLLNMLNIQNSD